MQIIDITIMLPFFTCLPRKTIGVDCRNPLSIHSTRVALSALLTLFLGAGESGKSTFAKQIRIIHLGGFSDEERIHFKEVIYENVMYSLKNLVQACEANDIKLNFENKVRIPL